ncbi:hypothetical protein KUTeg_003635 [Tegillarca granosa]|uniref:Uncharacterized protein n=2 Tax=Tegillarca granosa TaxID=220873 RepID=A0ABQ9FMM8_TEGGR|nr:hypothetical protein KUTeg_003635 [Tegillarca granosa]
MIILMVAFFMCCFPVGYSIVSITPSKGCGPFRIYTNMYQIVYITITVLPSWLQTIISIFTATSMIISVLVLLA